MKFVVLFLLGLTTSYAKAQTPQSSQKIGHADWEYIYGQLPEYKQIENELKAFETQLQNQFKTKAVEIETKYKAYRELPVNTPDAIKKDKESELTYLQENIQRFQQDAQVAAQKKQNDLLGPVFAKIGKAIEEVAIENGFSYIIDRQTTGGDILFFTDEQFNISNLVLKKLGVDPNKEKSTPVKQQ